MRLMTMTATCGLWLAIAGSASGQTLTAVADNRAGSVFAATNPESPASAGYAITPRTQFTPIDYSQTVNEGGASASILSQSEWLNVGPGNATTGFSAKGSLGVSLGPVSGTALANDYIQVQMQVGGLGPNETWLFNFVGAVTNTFSDAAVTLVGPGVNLAFGSEAEWETTLELVNGTYTLTIDATTSLTGTGPDIGNVDYDVLLERVPPLGELCSNAIPISAGVTLVSTVGRVGHSFLPATCEEGYGLVIYNDAFYAYEATIPGIATVTTCGPNTSFDTKLAVWSGSCDGLTLLACNDDSSACGIGTSSSLSFPTAAGERYVIQLGSFDGSTGDADLSVSQSCGCNDECAYAAPIFEGTTTVSTAGFTGVETPPASCADPDGDPNVMHNDAFFAYQATVTDIVTVHTCGPHTNFDTILAVYEGTCDDRTIVACSDDTVECGTSARVSFQATIGETYVIQLGSYYDRTGVADLTVERDYSNDECAKAAPIFDGTTTVSTAGMTGVYTPPPTCSDPGGDPNVMHNDAFFLYQATETGVVTVNTCGPHTNFDTVLAVYAGTCDDRAIVACNDDTPQCGLSSYVSFAAMLGESYVIRLGSYDENTGVADLTITHGLSNDECAHAATIVEGTTIVSTILATGNSALSPLCDEGYGVGMLNDVFFVYESTGNGTVTLETCSPDTTFDTRLAVYVAGCGSIMPYACNDDAAGCGVLSYLTFEATCGGEYLIQLGSYDGTTGLAALSVSQAGTCGPPCSSDLDGNDSVDGADMAILLGQWGGVGSGDIDGTGAVDAADLGILLGAWGACP
jgi:hypothetical protein